MICSRLLIRETKTSRLRSQRIQQIQRRHLPEHNRPRKHRHVVRALLHRTAPCFALLQAVLAPLKVAALAASQLLLDAVP